jgi:bacillithiol biosynthesis cysteine-adding enzyme BshC
MHKTLLPYPQIPQLAKTDVAYATGDPRLAVFYAHAPRLESFPKIIAQRAQREYPRADLVEVLRNQYAALPETAQVRANIEALHDVQTFTVTTAHQPSLFLGPLYFIYKALTTINLAEKIQRQVGDAQRILPMFVLGSEDHDIEELNKINLYGKRIAWQPETGGAVGSIAADTLLPALEELRSILGESDAAKALFERVERACLQANTFANATQALLHTFLGHYGLLVLNTNDPMLKRHFVPIAQAELLEQPAFRLVNETTAHLNELGFKTQAAPREINLFYLQPGSRERIVRQPDGGFQVLNSEAAFSETEILAELRAHPERFSPNVVLRPLYQETILPNLAYVGGGGELAYWLERKSLFEHFDVPFPALVRRNSVLWLDRDAQKKLAKFGFSAADFFGDTDGLLRNYVARNAAGEVDLQLEINALGEIFERVAIKATTIDPTLEKAVRAEAAKAAAGLEQWQGRLVRAEKQKHEVTLNQMRALKEKLFPNNGLQERHDNFLPYVLKYGDAFLAALKENLNPFEAGFVILEEE